VLAQYAVAHFVEKDNTAAISLEDYKAQELAKVTNPKEKELLKSHPEVLTMKYYLTDFGKTDEESLKAYYEAEYGLKRSMNTSLDSSEANYVKAHEHNHEHDDTRVTPTDANTEKEDYIPLKDGKLNYDVYTGRNLLEDCGEYEKVAGSTKSTRMKAYNVFLSNLQSYGLIKEGENAAKITELDYYYEELSSTLSQALVNKYYKELQDEAEGSLTKEKVFAEYETLRSAQEAAYKADYTAFETAMNSVSDTSFLLYGLDGYGYVYNILLPFSQEQTQDYKAVQTDGKYKDNALYKYREGLLKNVQGKDLRGAWFCEDEHEHYAYEKDGKYYFFEDNFTNNDKYEKIGLYAGNYAYNGTATQDEEDEWTCTPNKLGIDEFIDEFVSYVSTTAENTTYTMEKPTTYGTYYKKVNGKDEIDYNGFVYAEGKFDLGTVAAENYFNADTKAYKALSAVNELMFAYSTDTGCLNTYMGYAVNAHKTSFVSEFEYAAQKVVNEGVGSFAVVPSDYGWHIIYCSYVFDGGDVYSFANADELAADRETEGTFSYLFYEALKATSATTQASAQESKIIKEYKNSVTRYVERYQDLLDIE